MFYIFKKRPLILNFGVKVVLDPYEKMDVKKVLKQIVIKNMMKAVPLFYSTVY